MSSGPLENDGTFSLGANSSLEVNGAGQILNNGTLNLGAGVTVDDDNNFWLEPFGLVNEGTITAADNVVFTGYGSTLNASVINLGAGDEFTIDGSATLENQGTLNLTDGANLTANGTLDNTGGNIDLTNTTFSTDGDTISGTLSADNDSTVINTGTLNLSTAINSGHLLLASGATLDNKGTLETDANVSLPDVNLENEGTLNVSNGAFSVTGSIWQNNGNVSISNGAELDLDDGTTDGNYDLGVVTNNGTLHVLGGTATISDLVASGSLIVDSAASLFAPAQAPSNLTVDTSSGGATLCWTNNSAVNDGFIVYDSIDNGATWNEFDQTDQTTYFTGSLDADTSYLFRVTALGSNGETSPTSTVTCVSPAAPSNLSATYSSDGTSAALSWTNNSSLSNVVFIVQRQDLGGSWQTVSTTAQTTYTDASFSGGNAGVYRVLSAVTSDGTTIGTVQGSSSTDAVAPPPLQIPDGSAVYYTTLDTGTGTTVPMQEVPGQLDFAYGGGGTVDPAPLTITQIGTVDDPNSPWYGWPTIQTQPIIYPQSQSMTFTVDLPAHYGATFGVSASASEPGMIFTLTGPGGTAYPSSGSFYGFQTLSLTDETNTASTATYTLSVSGGDSSSTWMLFNAGASIFHTHIALASPITPYVGQTVSEPVTVTNAWGNAVSDDSVTVKGYDDKIIDATVDGSTVSDGTTSLSVTGVNAGTSPVILADDHGGAAAAQATTAPVPRIDSVTVTLEPGGTNRVDDIHFSVKIEIHGVALDKMQIRQDMYTSTKMWDPQTGNPGTNDVVQSVEEVLTNRDLTPDEEAFLNSGDSVPDPQGGWKDWTSMPNLQDGNKTSSTNDEQKFQQPFFQLPDGSKATYLTNVTRTLKLRFFNTVTNKEEKPVIWWWNWTNKPAEWTDKENPPPPQNFKVIVVPTRNNNKGDVTGTIQGIAALN